jgi:mannose-1-phosphate guanylyltransferase
VIIPVILAGGFGKRLQPLSTNNRPKQFIKLIDNYSTFQHSVRNALAINQQQIIILANVQCAQLIAEQLVEIKVTNAQIIFEASSLNTAMAISIAGIFIAKININACMLVLPADHLISDVGVLQQKLLSFTNIKDKLILFGIKPLWPEINYGYIQATASLLEQKELFKIDKFIEKPDLQHIKSLTPECTYWNSGIFLFPIIFLLQEIQNLDATMLTMANNMLLQGVVVCDNVYLADSFKDINTGSIDCLLLENNANLFMAKLNITWRDLGTWSSLLDFFYQQYLANTMMMEVVDKSWGEYVVIKKGEGFLVKIITLKPYQQTSLQYHKHRSEYFMVLKGEARIFLEDQVGDFAPGQCAYIDTNALHQISNPHANELQIIEMQIGDILQEDDIVRIEQELMLN